MLLFRQPRLNVAGDLMLCHCRGIWVPGLFGQGRLRQSLVVLLIVLLLELLGGQVPKIGRVHGLVRRIGAAVVHLFG